MTTGFIGLGHMGGAMARRLLAAGYELMVYDLNAAASDALVALGARKAVSPREIAAEAQVVFLSLPSIDATRNVAAQLSGGGRLQVLVETSTVGPAAVRELVKQMIACKVSVVDAPVSGGPRAAVAGTLSMMHSGSSEAVGIVSDRLSVIAARLFDVGTEPGLAQVCKLVNNAISAAGMVAACEATVVGVKAGLEAGNLLAAINAGTGRNAATLDKFPKSILPGTFDYGGPLGLMIKDLRLFIEESERYGLVGVMAPATLQVWLEAVQRSGPDADYSVLIRHLEMDAGVEVRSQAITPT